MCFYERAESGILYVYRLLLLFQLIKYILGPSVGTRPRALVGAGSEMIVCNVLTCYKGVFWDLCDFFRMTMDFVPFVFSGDYCFIC